MYSDFLAKSQAYLDSFKTFIQGNGTAPTFDKTIDFSDERNILQNASSAETLIYISNAMYDQAAAMRTIKEIYKSPQDYYKEHQKFLEKTTTSNEFLGAEFKRQQATLNSRISIAKAFKSRRMTLKLSSLLANFMQTT